MRNGCEFCYLISVSSSRPSNKTILPLTYTGSYQVELTCTYPPHVGSNCPKILKNIKNRWRRQAYELGDKPTQYANTPSCDRKGKFGNRLIFQLFLFLICITYQYYYCRYFSPGIYDKLLAVKRFWDPQNKFNHCQSIGNVEENCCPTQLK